MNRTSRELFKKKVVDAGFEVEDKESLYYMGETLMGITKDGLEVAVLDTDSKYSYSTLFRNFDELSDDEKDCLIEYLTEYSSSIGEDEKLEKYRYKNSNGEYINLGISNDQIFFSSRANTDEYQTEFTDDEVDELEHERYLIFEACQKELVE